MKNVVSVNRVRIIVHTGHPTADVDEVVNGAKGEGLSCESHVLFPVNDQRTRRVCQHYRVQDDLEVCAPHSVLPLIWESGIIASEHVHVGLVDLHDFRPHGPLQLVHSFADCCFWNSFLD